MDAIETAPVTVESLEGRIAGSQGFVEHEVVAPQPYGRGWFCDTGKETEPRHSHEDLVRLFKSMNGSTVIRVYQAINEHGTSLKVFFEPAYSTEKGRRAACLKWLEWLRGLHNHEKRDYLEFYETK